MAMLSGSVMQRPSRAFLVLIRMESSAMALSFTAFTVPIPDSAVRSVMKYVTKVFVGADTITSHGTLINKIGTSQVALAANEARVQVYVCSETYKFSPMTLFGDMVTIEERDHAEVIGNAKLEPGVKIFNPVFDSTPSKYIDAIITEVGMIAPGSVYHVMTSQLGDEIFKLIGE